MTVNRWWIIAVSSALFVVASIATAFVARTPRADGTQPATSEIVSGLADTAERQGRGVQLQWLDDGVVTLQELNEATELTAQCAESLDVGRVERYYQDDGRLSYRFYPGEDFKVGDVPPDDECWRKYLSETAIAYSIADRPSDAEIAESFETFTACLRDAAEANGVRDVEDLDQVELSNLVDANQLLACAVEADI